MKCSYQRKAASNRGAVQNTIRIVREAEQADQERIARRKREPRRRVRRASEADPDREFVNEHHVVVCTP